MVQADYIKRVECRNASKRFGHFLHSRLEGTRQKLERQCHPLLSDANTKQSATLRTGQKGVRAAHITREI